ncbi:TrkH family potassium uptake protein [Cytobacillus gottheilii]|uniref:TrkH family potassium uptake protein n=1 Tax=Cytobacillus gottheilii TaxID=859144 RepID=UPI0009BC54E1|nr:TrkH family potassium uptake protein [Cytobacillus gottheilii]
MNIKYWTFNPAQLIVSVFALFAVMGTVLLKLPIATEEGVSWMDAAFISTSAITVTGLASVDPGSTFTLFGEIVLMFLMQIGGIGVMCYAVLIYVLIGKKIKFKERLLIQQALNQNSLGGVIRLARSVLIYSFVIEAAAALLLSIRLVPEYGFGKGLYYSLFHSISAFNNAGLALWSDGLTGFVGDPVMNIVITMLFIFGGLGFTVIGDLVYAKRFRQLTLHSKMMITGTFVINLFAMFVIFFLEFNNEGTLGPLSLWEKAAASYFQAVTPRTAGFNTVDISSIEDPTAFFMMLLMFIGAGSTSTGGGIKLTTFLILLLAAITFIRGKKDTVIFRRRLQETTIMKALAIAVTSLLFICMAIFLLTIFEERDFLPLAFEVISAFGTVGLSMGVTPELSVIGKLIIMFIMFLGNIGPLTLAYTLAKPDQQKIRYPQEDVLTG